jgi:pyruvate/2-oxoglutarate dehydrogenase complex dihydrolipoamide acyltransferase (E2) component
MDVKLPKLGEGADSGVVVNVFVKEGDQIARNQAILELENEKAVASVPSTAAGVVTKIYVKAGDKISVGQRLISLSGGDQPAAAVPTAKQAALKSEPETPVEEFAAEIGDEIPKPVAAPVASPAGARVRH